MPVFTELLEQGRKREAVRLASTLFWLILIVLGALTALFILVAGVIMPLFIRATSSPPRSTTSRSGSRSVLFPIVVLLGLNGLLVGILNAYDHFTIPAIAPLVWNVVIIACLVVLRRCSTATTRSTPTRSACCSARSSSSRWSCRCCGRIDFRLKFALQLARPARQHACFVLMLPVTIGLGVINFDLLINSLVGSLISDSAPRAIDAALPDLHAAAGDLQRRAGDRAVPVAQPRSWRAMTSGLRALVATGTRQIMLLLVPAGGRHGRARRADRRGSSTSTARSARHRPTRSTKALFWFAFSLPFAGINLLLTRTFFSLQRPWIPTALAAVNLLVNLVVSLALYEPLGIAGPVIGTVVAQRRHDRRADDLSAATARRQHRGTGARRSPRSRSAARRCCSGSRPMGSGG